jgi:STE24 endopeptidase
MRQICRLFFLAAAILLACHVLAASPIARDLPPGFHVPAGAQVGPNFDVDRATNAWLGLLSPEQKALSDRYCEGGYWIQLWQFLYRLAIAAILIFTGISQKVRDAAQRFTRRSWLSNMLYGVFYLLAVWLLSLPLAIYTDFVREQDYGLSNLTFAGFMTEGLKSLIIMLIIAPIVIAVLYACIRKTGKNWWKWATVLSFVFTLFISFIAPVYLSPIFNQYKPLPDGPVRDAVLSLARANRIPTDHVVWFDASKQTTRISANVSGLGNTTQVSLNDNLIKRTSLPEIKAILGHEMGHYVLNHATRLTIYLTLVIGLALAIVHFTLDKVLARWGERLKLHDRADIAALPLVAALFSSVFFVLTPLNNSIIRQAEAEADAFGLNAAHEPQAFALSAMRLSTYRKLEPGYWEEVIFYDHPSGYTRVHNSMIWQKENLGTGTQTDAPPAQ